MKNTKLVVSDKDLRKQRTSLVVVFIDEQKNITSFLDKQIKRKIKNILQIGDFRGKKAEYLVFYPETSQSRGRADEQRLLMVGLGDTRRKKQR